jgi:hypothetical protein
LKFVMQSLVSQQTNIPSCDYAIGESEIMICSYVNL